MKVGIDLSSTNTGLVILSDDNKLIWHGNFQLWDSDRFVIASKVSDMINTIMCKRLPNEVINVGVELADFKNANITNRFNLLTGMIISELGHWMEKGVHTWNTPLVKLKLFNSNEWQSIIWDKSKYIIESRTITINGKKKQQFRIINSADAESYFNIMLKRNINDLDLSKWLDKRGILKLLSRIFTIIRCHEYQDTWTEDECDAYCIAYFLPQLRDRTQMHQEVKAKKVQEKKSKLAEKNEQIKKWRKENKFRQIQTKYLNILASGKKLTKAQDRALDNAIKELKELENEKIK